tara:strand:+ start:638 stop:916 length:279 start_codon:yes stop_codon:yes gene_type:complete
MVERKNRGWYPKGKTTEWLLYVLRKAIRWGRLGLSALLGYTTKKGEEIVDRIKTILELRRTDRMMRERANTIKWHENAVEEGKRVLPEVWGE